MTKSKYILPPRWVVLDSQNWPVGAKLMLTHDPENASYFDGMRKIYFGTLRQDAKNPNQNIWVNYLDKPLDPIPTHYWSF